MRGARDDSTFVEPVGRDSSRMARRSTPVTAASTRVLTSVAVSMTRWSIQAFHTATHKHKLR